jgi:hypothetical protein
MATREMITACWYHHSPLAKRQLGVVIPSAERELGIMMMVENKYMNEEMRQFIKDTIKKEIPVYTRGATFTDRKITDTPTDSLSVVNRKFVTNNGI